VSTILRALKKLEQDNADAPMGSAAATAFKARQAVQRGVRFAWRKGQLIRWGMFFLVITGGIVALAQFYPFGGTQPSPRWTGTSDFFEAADPAGDTAGAPSSFTAHLIPEGTDDFIESDVEQNPRKGMDVVGVEPPAEKSYTPPPPAAATRAPSSALLHRPQSPAGIPQTGSPPARQDQTPLDAERLPEGLLKIQAIAWAPDVQDRMAVINNRILHEGESVEGYTILAITEDQILLGAEGRRWKAVFGRR
jgi:hypothetical protein